MALFYRGICRIEDEENDGRLKPKGHKSQVTPLHDGKLRHDGKFTHGETDDNAARAHHIESGLYGGCFVSFTKSRAVAEKFALIYQGEPCTEGFIYVVDEELLEPFGVVAKEFSDPEHPKEMEVSLRASDCGEIPMGIVIKKIQISDRWITHRGLEPAPTII